MAAAPVRRLTDDVPADVERRLRRLCLALPDAYEEHAWVGTRWRVRTRTFVHVLGVDDPVNGTQVVMTFREKTGTRRETHAVQNYRQELVPLVTNAGTKPFEVDFQPETLEEQLTRLLTEDPHARA